MALKTEEDFYILSMYLRYFVIISIWKERSPPFEKKNPLYPRMLCAILVKSWPLVLAMEKIFFYFVNVFSLFRFYLPLENGVDLH